jgi:porphobilinogen synthase
VASGVSSVLIFGVPESGKACDGRSSCDESGVVQESIRRVRTAYPELVVATDVCVCAYTDHGHCGILRDDGDVDNDATLEVLRDMAVSHAAAGADIVAPSAMMDGQIQAIRGGLDAAGCLDTILMSYSTKFASAMYGPFRDAAHSAPGKGDRKSYQAPYDEPRQAIRESLLDIEEGADMLMVKPSLFYLDLVQRLRQMTELPLAVYNVSGEYSMLAATAERGWGDLDGMVRESTGALVRAGADILISYWANQYDRIFGDG